MGIAEPQLYFHCNEEMLPNYQEGDHYSWLSDELQVHVSPVCHLSNCLRNIGPRQDLYGNIFGEICDIGNDSIGGVVLKCLTHSWNRHINNSCTIDNLCINFRRLTDLFMVIFWLACQNPWFFSLLNGISDNDGGAVWFSCSKKVLRSSFLVWHAINKRENSPTFGFTDFKFSCIFVEFLADDFENIENSLYFYNCFWYCFWTMNYPRTWIWIVMLLDSILELNAMGKFKFFQEAGYFWTRYQSSA